MRTGLLTAALVAPFVAASVVLAATVLGEGAGRAPFSDGGPRNSAEAAALGDAPAVVRFLQRGESPLRVHRLRPEIISSSVQLATTLEAAVWSRRIEMIQLLDREGAIVGQGLRRDIACLAADLALPEIVSHLATPGGAGCVPGEAMERVTERTRRGYP